MLLFPAEILSEATLLGSGPGISVAESASRATSERALDWKPGSFPSYARRRELLLSSNSPRNSFDHALRRQGRNDPCELVACGVEQGAEFRFGSFSPSGHH